jgi:sulfur-oxidizing protein SoxY
LDKVVNVRMTSESMDDRERKKNSRREFMRAVGGLAAGVALESATIAAAAAEPAPATISTGTRTTVVSMLDAIHKVVGAAPINKGKVRLDLPPLVENGNAVALTVSADSPMTQAEYVKAIHLFSEKNPQPYIATVHLGPRAGRARVATRVRLADTQTVVAICEMSDGSFWSDSVNVVVTLAACLEVL